MTRTTTAHIGSEDWTMKWLRRMEDTPEKVIISKPKYGYGENAFIVWMNGSNTLTRFLCNNHKGVWMGDFKIESAWNKSKPLLPWELFE